MLRRNESSLADAMSAAPATDALKRSLKRPSLVATNHAAEPMIKAKSMKRSRQQLGSFDNFDMSGFLEASQKVEDSIAFPTIEWPSLDSECDENEEDIYRPKLSSKRLCRGLVRSKQSFNLNSLEVERQGSNGSLC